MLLPHHILFPAFNPSQPLPSRVPISISLSTYSPSTRVCHRRFRTHHVSLSASRPVPDPHFSTSEEPYVHTQRSRSSPLPIRPAPDSAVRSSLFSLIAYYRLLCQTNPFILARLIIAAICVLISKILYLAVPVLLRRLLDSLAVKAISFSTVFPIIISYALARLAAGYAHEVRNGIFAKAGQSVGRAITAASFAHLHEMELAFHTGARTGALVRVVDRGTKSVMTIFRALMFAFLPTLFELSLVCLLLMKEFSPMYAAITIVTFITFVAWTLHINDRLGAVRGEMNAVENEASGNLADSLINVEGVKMFDNNPYELARYQQILGRYEALAIDNEWMYVTLNTGQGTIFTLGLTASLTLAARGVLNGSVTVGGMVMLAGLLNQLWVPLNFLGWQYREVKQSLIDLKNLFQILDRQSKITDADGAIELESGNGTIEFENVTFEYPADSEEGLEFLRKGDDKDVEELDLVGEDQVSNKRRIALDNLSFKVPAGSSLALVGESGSGKSTATRLLVRLYDCTSGVIRVDGQDISKVTLTSLRNTVSIVPQDTALFNDTIGYNIRYGKPDATDEEVITAAKAASIHDVIMRTENGYQTLVGERGVRLSGGERQRLSVARAFLKGSNIIIEDECTSALDTLTEMEISKSLEKLGVNRTRIIVAHRLSTIMNVDKIVVLQSGRKVEEGTLSELLSIPDGVFKGMWERQQKQEAESTSEGQVFTPRDG